MPKTRMTGQEIEEAVKLFGDKTVERSIRFTFVDITEEGKALVKVDEMAGEEVTSVIGEFQLARGSRLSINGLRLPVTLKPI